MAHQEYREDEFRALCERHFGQVDIFGVFHARKLAWHALALKLGWDRVHATLRITGIFYDRFTPAIAASDFQLRQRRATSIARWTSWPSAGRDAALSLVLHTHMPYVEGFGTWPFGEEWLWEAMATCYLPLLDVLDAHPAVTVSVTPVLADQLAAPGVEERFLAFLRGVREASHALDLEAHPEVARAAGALAGALPPRRATGPRGLRPARDLDLGHPRRPAAAGDGAGDRLQVRDRDRGAPRALRRDAAASGCRSARTSPGASRHGSGVSCVELPIRIARGRCAPPPGRCWCRSTGRCGSRVGADGYPSGAAYLDTRRTPSGHLAWSVDGSLYDPGAARAQVRADAADFARACPRGGLSSRSTPSCSGTGGRRAWTGWPPSWTSATST